MPAAPGPPSTEELYALPAAELAARLAEAYQLIAELSGQVERQTVLSERLSERVDELERQARRDSSASPRPPSSDSPYKKEESGSVAAGAGEARPGEQPGDPGVTMRLVDDPDESFDWSARAAGR